MLREWGDRPATLLDGNIVHRQLSGDLGFSREHRKIHLRRIGLVASEIVRRGGVAVCAPMAAYTPSRCPFREVIGAAAGFVEIHVLPPLETCEARDRKGLYAKARAGLIHRFTGIDTPYRAPDSPDIRIDTTDICPDLAAQHIFTELEDCGFIR